MLGIDTVSQNILNNVKKLLNLMQFLEDGSRVLGVTPIGELPS